MSILFHSSLSALRDLAICCPRAFPFFTFLCFFLLLPLSICVVVFWVDRSRSQGFPCGLFLIETKDKFVFVRFDFSSYSSCGFSMFSTPLLFIPSVTYHLPLPPPQSQRMRVSRGSIKSVSGRVCKRVKKAKEGRFARGRARERNIGIPPTLSRFLESDTFKYFLEPPSLFTPFVAASTVALARRGVPHGSLGSWSDGGRRDVEREEGGGKEKG